MVANSELYHITVTLNGTAMQTEKALISDPLRVSKVS